MRYLVPAAAISILAFASLTFSQYWTEVSAARQRVLSGSAILSTEYGDIEYAVRGEGPPVLLLHGAGGGYDQGLLLGETVLGSGFKQISVSRFGYLRSPVPRGFSVEAQAAAYASLLDHLGIAEVIVVGGSAGGPSALQFAHDYPDRTSALVLVAAVSKPMDPGEQDLLHIRAIHAIQRSDFLFWVVARAFQPQFLELVGVPSDVYNSFTREERELAQRMLDVMHPMGLRRTGSVLEGEIRPLDAASMGRISAPTLILHAKDDKLVVYRHAEHAHRAIGQSKLILFETGGHGLLAGISDVKESVRAFLEEVTLRRVDLSGGKS
jgi:pimeloyl-ACP methyl ester carboxylesterase